MSKAVWKFLIPESTWVYGPFGLGSDVSESINKVVHAKMQGLDLCIWAEVFPDIPAPVRKNLVVYGTGHPIASEEEYLFTIFDRVFVWHLYRIPSLGGPSR